MAAPAITHPRRRRAASRSRLGQNFLTDSGVARRIVSAAELGADDAALEIGPGRGALTRLLIRRARRVVAVEIDERLASALAAKHADCAALEIVEMDALRFDPAERFDMPYKLIANLPYYAATPMIRRFLALSPRPSRMVVMVQREVANGICAAPGRMGLLSVMVQMRARARALFTVPPRAFRPQPKVASSVVLIQPYERPIVHADDPQGFVEFVAAGFRAPRKQMANSLRLGLRESASAVRDALADADIEPSRRPSTLSLAEWGDLYSAWRARHSVASAAC